MAGREMPSELGRKVNELDSPRLSPQMKTVGWWALPRVRPAIWTGVSLLRGQRGNSEVSKCKITSRWCGGDIVEQRSVHFSFSKRDLFGWIKSCRISISLHGD